jgi:hypothetical protein
VVASPQAAEGIRAEAGRDYALARDEASFAAAVVAALRARASNPGARERVLVHYDWARNVAVVDPLLDAVPASNPALRACPA